MLPVRAATAAVCLLACSPQLLAQGQGEIENNIGVFLNFESPQVHPLALSADGSRLFAVDTPDARLSVFDVTTASNPTLVAEIPVGIEPVSVRPRTADEIWVVNHTSDSISVVSLAQGIVTDTIPCVDEPCDVVFAGSPQRAYVSVAGSRQVRVFDTSTHALVATIPIQGVQPRSLAVSGNHVYVAVAISGNRTTILPANVAPAPPAPTRAGVGPAPQVGLIVDSADPQWAAQIPYTVADHDVVDIDTTTNTVARMFAGVGTINFNVTVGPGGDLFVVGTEALNLVRFEPALRGHAVDNLLTRIDAASGAITHFDLNAGVDYTNPANPAAKAIALAQPTDVVFSANGQVAYVAAFGTDRVARVDPTTGAVLARIEIGGTPGAVVDPRHKRGPRALALHAASGRLFVLNRIANTISVVNTANDTLGIEVPVGAFDPTPVAIREGRGFLYDAKLSGNGTMSCASCHCDGDSDYEDWDLGDPDGPEIHLPDPSNTYGMITMHPQKGPLYTQTLRGLSQGSNPLHWRGDRSDFTAFNGAFESLMGGTQIAATDMQAFADFANACEFEGNPNLRLDRSLPATVNGGDPTNGLALYTTGTASTPLGSCNSCHHLPLGTGSKIVNLTVLGQPQGLKVPQLRTAYQKLGFDTAPGSAPVVGFGFGHDGTEPTIESFLSNPTTFGALASDPAQKRDLAAFVLCIDTNTAPAVGHQVTLKSTNLGNTATSTEIATMIARADISEIDLVVKGRADGAVHGFLYVSATGLFQSDHAGYGPFTLAQLRAKVQAGGVLTFLGVPEGSGQRMGVDRDMNQVPDADEAFFVLESFGQATPPCAGALRLASNSQPYCGNSGFAFFGTQALPNGFAVVLISPGQGLEPGPVLFGVTAWVDPTALLMVPMTSDDLGFGFAPMPIPYRTNLIDTNWSAMIIDVNPCNASFLTGSQGVRFDLPDGPN